MKAISKHQQGYTLISLIFILGLLAFFVLLIVKIGPIYMDHSKVVSVLSTVEKSTGIETKSEYEVRETIAKHFNMSYVSRLDAKDLKISKRGNYLKVEANYEVVEKILGNVSVLVEFNDSFEVGAE